MLKPSAEVGYTIAIQQLEAQPAAVIRFRIPPTEIATKLSESLPKIFGYIAGEKGLQPASPPFARYHDMADGKFDMEAGFMLQESVNAKGDIQSVELPAGPAAMTWHVGPYDQLKSAHDALTTWASENGRTPAGGPWEIYVTDPGDEPDPNKWRTQLFLPLAAK